MTAVRHRLILVVWSAVMFGAGTLAQLVHWAS